MATVTKKVNVKQYSIGAPLGPNDKCPPQAKLILDKIAAAPDGKIFRADLIAEISKPPAEGGLTTRQDPTRILGFYQPKLVEAGHLTVTDVEIEVTEEVPDKPEPVAPAAAADGVAAVDGGASAPAEAKQEKKHKGKEKVAA